MHPIEQWEATRRSGREFIERSFVSMVDAYAQLGRCHLDTAEQICLSGSREAFDTLAKADAAAIVEQLPRLADRNRQRAQRIAQDYTSFFADWQKQMTRMLEDSVTTTFGPLLESTRQMSEALSAGAEPPARRVIEHVEPRMRKQAA